MSDEFTAKIKPMPLNFYRIEVRRGYSRIYRSELFFSDWFAYGSMERAEEKARGVLKKLQAKRERLLDRVNATKTITLSDPDTNL